VCDPDGIEGPAGDTAGLGHLDIDTTMTTHKRLTRVRAQHCTSGTEVSGYEIHIGRSDGPARARPFARIGDADEGATSPDGRIMGSYLHGLFREDAFRAAFLAQMGAAPSGQSYDARVEGALDDLAAHIEAHLDVGALLSIAR